MEDTTSENNKVNQEEPETMNMADRFITAMFLPKEYDKLLKLKVGKMVSYLAVLLLLISVIHYAIPALAAIASLGGIRNIALREIPEFSLENGVFSYEEKYEKLDKDMGVYILIDTETEAFSKEDIPADMVEAIMVSKSNILVYNSVSGLGGIVQESIFAREFKGITINNQILADGSLFIYMLLLVIFAVIYCGTVVGYLFSALFYALIMYLLMKTMMMDLTFGTVYRIALYAQSIGAVVVAITYCVGSPLFLMAGSAFNMLITVMIMNRALIQMKLQEDAML